jgi:hypothetical protein
VEVTCRLHVLAIYNYCSKIFDAFLLYFHNLIERYAFKTYEINWLHLFWLGFQRAGAV